MPAIKPITMGEVEYISHALAKKLMEWDEPIPEFNTRYPRVLESCLAVPFQRFNNKTPYKGLTGKASMLFYLMIKNHPFQNGNKRIAITTLLYLLTENDKWLRVDDVEFYNFAVWVALSNPTVRHTTIEAIEIFIKKYLIDIKG